MGIGFIFLRLGLVVYCCEHNSEHLGAIKYGNFFVHLANCLLVKNVHAYPMYFCALSSSV